MSQTLEHAAHDLAAVARDVRIEAEYLFEWARIGGDVSKRLSVFRKALARLDKAAGILAAVVAMDSPDADAVPLGEVARDLVAKIAGQRNSP